VTDLQGVTDNGNVTTNVVQFSNATTGLVTTANIEVGGDIKVVGLSAGTVPYVASDKFLKDSFITMTGDATVITSNLDVTGNIFMRGNKFIVESETKLINDAIIGIANNNASSTTDKGIIMQNDPSNANGNVAIIHHGAGDGFADQLTFGYTADPLDTLTVTNDLTKELTVNVLGNVITQNNLSIGGLLKINTISAASSHSLQAVTNLGNVTSNTVQFSNAITSLVASSNIVATGNVSAGRNTDTTSYFGRAAVGYMGTSDQASFAHFDRNSSAQYALKQTAAGPTYINTPASGHIRFTVNDGNAGAEKMRITSAGKVGIGVSAPHANLHVEGNAYVSSNLTVGGNVEVGTANLFVDTVNSRVGIGTSTPGEKLHVNGNIRLGASADNTADDNTDRTISTAAQLTIKANDSDIDGAYTNLILQSGNTNPGKIIIGGDDGATGSNGSRIDFYTAGATAPVCKIDRDGYLLPKAFAFMASGSGGDFKTQKSLMHDPVMTITVHFDYHPNPNGIYTGFREQASDANRGIYFAPISGVYHFSCKARIPDNTTNAYEIEWYIKRNGTHSSPWSEVKYTTFEMWASPGDGGGRRAHMSSTIVKLEEGEGFMPRNDGPPVDCSRVTFGGHFLGTYD
jgi:hypothetical protein